MYYRVKPGESLDHICHRFQVKQEELMAANQMIASTVTPNQLLFIPLYSVRKSLNLKTDEAILGGELNENNDWRQIIPQSTSQIPGLWPEDTRKGHKIAVFRAKDINKDIPIYNSRAAFFFMSKMAVEKTGCFSICDHSVRPCGECFKSESTPFYVMPHNTSFASLGDYGLVINTRTKKTSFAICADWGPKHEAITIETGTKFSGKIGEGSIFLGKQLQIKDIDPNPLKAFEPFGVLYIIFPGSAANGVRTIKSVEEIKRDAQHAFEKWGGMKQARFVLKEHYNIDY